MAKEDYKGIWIFAEQQNGVLHPAVAELLAKAQELKAHNGETISAVLLGDGVTSLAADLIAQGADQVITAENAALRDYSARPYQQALTQLAEKYKPSIILYGATSLGRDLAPRVMVSLRTGLTADAIDLGYDEDDVFYQTTPAYGGSILAHIVILECRPQMATVRPKIFAPLEPDFTRTGAVIAESVEVVCEDAYEVLSVEPKAVNGTPIDKANVLVCGGRGIKVRTTLPPCVSSPGFSADRSPRPVRSWTTAGSPMMSRSVSPARASSRSLSSTSPSPAPCSIRSVCRTPSASSASITPPAHPYLIYPTTALSATISPSSPPSSRRSSAAGHEQNQSFRRTSRRKLKIKSHC